MALKWGAVVVAAVSITLFATANIIVSVQGTSEVPAAFNMATVAAASVGVVLAVFAELYTRVNGRINALAEFVALRLNEVDAHTGDRNAGFVEGYLLSHGEEAAAVVPFGQRAARRMGVVED
jgi:predicted component of type VI protein secretion system